MSCRGRFVSSCLLGLLTAFVASCSLIDDDLSNCGEEFRLEYQLKLVTNMETELETVLHAASDLPVQTALRRELQNIFTDYARDVSLSFYDTDSLRSVYEEHTMNASEATYTVYLPVRQYMNLALTNMKQQHQVTADNELYCHRLCLRQTAADTVDSHETGLFTARQPMNVVAGQSQSYYVRLYMANSAAALVVDTTGCDIRHMQIYIDDLADGFLVRDSLYTFQRNSAVRTYPIDINGASSRADATAAQHQVCFLGVGFPSRDVPISDPGYEGTVWRVRTYVTLSDGTTTETIFHVRQSLKAGNLKIIRCQATANGIIETSNTEVGASVTLDWKPGSTYNPQI